MLDRAVTYAEIHDGRLILGHLASFVSYPIVPTGIDPTLSHPISLVQASDKTLNFLQTESALCAVPMTRVIEIQNDNQSTSDNSSNQILNSSVHIQSEFLLCFKKTAVYVDSFTGQRTRQTEIQYPTPAEYICYNNHLGALLVFTNRGIDIFSVQNAEWIQSIPIKNATPLNNYGRLVKGTDSQGVNRYLYIRKNPKSNSLEIDWFKPGGLVGDDGLQKVGNVFFDLETAA